MPKLVIFHWKKKSLKCEPWLLDLLPCFQGDDDEDGSPVHAAHTAAVAHEVVKDGGELRAHLQPKEMLDWSKKKKIPKLEP